MRSGLKAKVERLERHGTGNGADVIFYLLWVAPGTDRASALAACHERGDIPDNTPSYCAEWKLPENYRYRNHVLGPMPESRLTSSELMDEDEEAVVWESLGDDIEAMGLLKKPSTVEAYARTKASEMTDRQLIGAIIAGCA